MAASDTAPRIGLPSDLSKSLRYLDDASLQRLRDAVNAEIERRGSSLREKERGVSGSAETAQIPKGKANLIRASFKAGVTPAAIARTLGISQALVRRVLKSKTS